MQIRRGKVVRVKSKIEVFLLADRIQGDVYTFITRWRDDAITTMAFLKHHHEPLCEGIFVVDSLILGGPDLKIVGVCVSGYVVPIQCVSLVEPTSLTDEEKLMIVKYKLEQ